MIRLNLEQAETIPSTILVSRLNQCTGASPHPTLLVLIIVISRRDYAANVAHASLHINKSDDHSCADYDLDVMKTCAWVVETGVFVPR